MRWRQQVRWLWLQIVIHKQTLQINTINFFKMYHCLKSGDTLYLRAVNLKIMCNVHNPYVTSTNVETSLSYVTTFEISRLRLKWRIRIRSFDVAERNGICIIQIEQSTITHYTLCEIYNLVHNRLILKKIYVIIKLIHQKIGRIWS